MKILCLYNNDIALDLFDWLTTQGHKTVKYCDKLNVDWCRKQDFDLTVSYTYRYILTGDVLEVLNYNAVNIHNAFLPFNRGADPNLWSILEDTPRGVTLHYMNSSLDKGSIIVQMPVSKVKDSDTLESSYNTLDQAAKNLFKSSFQYYDYWQDMKKEVCAEGSYHKSSDSRKIKEAISDYGGYGITIDKLRMVYDRMTSFCD